MKRLLLLLFMALTLNFAAQAKGDPDFASKFLMLYGKTCDIDCKTISPQMMERILNTEAENGNEQTRQIFSQIKSIRILSTAPNIWHAKTLFEKAENLAETNKRRYTAYSQTNAQNIYVRRRGKQILEVVVMRIKDGHTFYMLNLTGNMSDNFLQQVSKL